MSTELEGPLTTVLTIRTGRKLAGNPTLRKPSPDVIEVLLPGVSLRLPDDYRLETESVSDLSVKDSAAGTVISLKLPRPMGAQVNASRDMVRIELLKPRVGNGRLTGKIIVVDPGHGGRAGGATSGGVREKDLTLSIGKLLAAGLAEQGATVIMTRKTDIDVGLSERAAIANRNGAHFFLSVHINSTGRVTAPRAALRSTTRGRA